MTLERDEAILVSRVNHYCDLHITQETELHCLLDQTLPTLAESDGPRAIRVNLLIAFDFALAHFRKKCKIIIDN